MILYAGSILVARILIIFSILQDNFIIIHVRDDYASLLESVFKTEFLFALSKKYLEDIGHLLNVRFNNKYGYFSYFTYVINAAYIIHYDRFENKIIYFQLGV